MVNSTDYNDFLEFKQYHNNAEVNAYFYKTQVSYHNSAAVQNIEVLKAFVGEEPVTDLEAFNNLRQLAIDYQKDKNDFAQYESDLEAYYANQAAWAYYNEMATALADWDAVIGEYNTKKAAYDEAVIDHNDWVNRAKSYQTLIPTGAYFLGRKGTDYPKYYREIADDTRAITDRTGGFWTQFTAVIIPNDAAINGIERKLGPGIANNTKGLNMVFDEGFMGEFNPTEIKDIVAEAEEKGQKVEYMNIVYSINGEVVGRGSHSLSNLPQGMYIINGKKYLVK